MSTTKSTEAGRIVAGGAAPMGSITTACKQLGTPTPTSQRQGPGAREHLRLEGGCPCRGTQNLGSLSASESAITATPSSMH